jgi:hypothetical protein
LAALVFPLIQIFQQLKKAKTILIGIGLAVVLFSLCYVLASDAPFKMGNTEVAGSQMKLVEASMFAFYALLATSILAILYSSISRYFKQ